MAQATSNVATATAPKLMGIWLHSTEDPEGTSVNYLYGNIGRTETVGVQNTGLKFVGRTYPVYDSGGFESQTLELNVIVPSGPDEQDQVDWFRFVVRARRTLCYRDSRGRQHYVIISGLTITDERVGTSVKFTATTVDYTEE